MDVPSPSWSSAAEFEAAVQVVDAAVRGANKRTRDNALQTRRLLRRPPQQAEYPFHSRESVLDAALEAVTAVTGVPSPNFDLFSDPRNVYKHICEAVIKYGDECREEGRGLEREGAEPRIRPDTASEAMRLMSQLNKLLSTASRYG